MPRWRSGTVWPKRLLTGAIALALVTAAGVWLAPRDRASIDRTPSGAGPRSYADALARLDASLIGTRDLRRARQDEWLLDERLAHLLLSRARLTGRFEDYAEAQRVLDHAFLLAPAGAGPHQTQMALAFSLHRLSRTEAMIRAIENYAVKPEYETRSELALTRGDIAFYRGDYAGALRTYRQGMGDDGAGPPLRIANLLARTGKPDAALEMIDRYEVAAKLPTAQALADLALRRGSIELQRGAWDEAGRQFDRAERLFPGWWLTQALQAQMLAVSGRYPEAVAAFQTVLRTNACAECMDALASIHRAQGHRDQAAAWAARAGQMWDRRMVMLPEAALGHAAEHELAFGDADKALRFARSDAALRPYGQSETTLAWALLAKGEADAALRVIDRPIAAGWVSAESHLAKEQALLLLGRSTEAEAERAAALAINPHAGDAAGSLIWIGH